MNVRTYLILSGSGEEKHKSKVNTGEDNLTLSHSYQTSMTVTKPADLPWLCDTLCKTDAWAANAVTKIFD